VIKAIIKVPIHPIQWTAEWLIPNTSTWKKGIRQYLRTIKATTIIVMVTIVDARATIPFLKKTPFIKINYLKLINFCYFSPIRNERSQQTSSNKKLCFGDAFVYN
jgi:hypothetical protein